jgi:hypothetical protein
MPKDPPTNKISASKHVLFSRDKIPIHFESKLICLTNARPILGILFPKNKTCLEAEILFVGVFRHLNQHDFFRPEIQTRKVPSGDPAFQTHIHPHWGSNRRNLKGRNFWSASIQNLQSGIWVLLAEAFPTRYGSAIFVTSAYALWDSPKSFKSQ